MVRRRHLPDGAACARGELTLGAFSVYGWQHPGPALFYWLAPFYAAAGRQPAGLLLGTAVANVVTLTALVALLRRFGGEVAGWIAAAGVVAFLWRYGLYGLWLPWNPTLTVVPMAVLLVTVAAVAAGHRWALPLLVGLASWQVQAHLGTGVAVAGPTVAAAVLVAAGIRRGGLDGWRAPLLATAAVAAVLWAAPLADQVAGSHNMTTVARYLATGEAGPGATHYETAERAFTPRQAVGEVGLVGSLLSSDETGRFIGPDRPYARATGRTAPTAVAYVVLVLAAGTLGTIGFRRGRRFGPALCGTVVLASGLAWASVAIARGGASHHIAAFVAGIGLAAWLAVAIETAALVGDRRAGSHPRRDDSSWPAAAALVAKAGVVAAAAASTIALVQRPAPILLRNPGYDSLTAAVEGVAEGTIVLDTPGLEGPLLRVTLAMTKDGYDVRVPAARQFSFTRAQWADPTWDMSVWIALADRRPPGEGWTAAATATDPWGAGVTIYTRPGPH